jgi:hypothetical protein
MPGKAEYFLRLFVDIFVNNFRSKSGVAKQKKEEIAASIFCQG